MTILKSLETENDFITVSDKSLLQQLLGFIEKYNTSLVQQRPSYLELKTELEVNLFTVYEQSNHFMPIRETMAQVVPEWAGSINQINSTRKSDLIESYCNYYIDEGIVPPEMWHCPLALRYVEHDWTSGEEISQLFESYHSRMLDKILANQKSNK